jgi:hypothetical protein
VREHHEKTDECDHRHQIAGQTSHFYPAYDK